MTQAKLSRNRKRQLGQFFTPASVANAIVGALDISVNQRVLEPSLGQGAFVFAVVDALSRSHSATEVREWARNSFYGCEIDAKAFEEFAAEWRLRGLGEITQNVSRGDFFRWMPGGCDSNSALNKNRYFQNKVEMFDLIIGNPPFGGSIDPDIQDQLDALFGIRDGIKIKKETYAFFLVKCLDMLAPGGKLCFICSDTILTIPTMRGLRNLLQGRCDVDISRVPGAFDEVSQELVLITATRKNRRATHVTVFGERTSVVDIERTRNLSWRAGGEFATYFSGQTLGDGMVASSGMTIGNNDLFLRQITNGAILEPYVFEYADEPITLARELERARLGYLSPARQKEILIQEQQGERRQTISWRERDTPLRVTLPDDDYRFYNKASSQIVYSRPEWTIFWRDNGHYVYTFKKAGNWYLHGVGGKPFFGREGLTWGLISNRLRMRWLPEGYILDSGAPCAFLRPGVPHDELFFILGWTLTDLCTRILKNVINHTRNIQSKDFERLPYPVWMSPSARDAAIDCVRSLIDEARAGKVFDFDSPRVKSLNELYRYDGGATGYAPPTGIRQHRVATLF